MAQTILNTRTLSDEDKAALQNLIDLSEKAKEAYEALNDFFIDIFGNLGAEMMDSVVTAFKKGESAAESFYKSVSTMLENLAKQMIYSVTLGPLLEEAQEQMLAVMTTPELTDEQKFDRWTTILSTMLQDAVNQQDLANRLLTEYQQLAESKGFDLFKDSYSQKPSSAFSTSMSQETGEALEGRFTAIQINTANILASVMEIQTLIILQVNHLESISNNTKLLTTMNTNLASINEKLKNI